MMKNKISVKTKEEIEKMAEGGMRLKKVKKALLDKVQEGVSAAEIEDLAVKLIDKQKGKPSFKMVPGYSWATCVNINSGVVHGIPHKKLIIKKGDVVSIDVGMFYRGFHTDTSFTVGIGLDSDMKKFLDVGKEALKKATEKVKVGNRIYDISKSIQETVESAGHKPLKALVGHGIGKNLHEGPEIPCFVSGTRKDSPEICEGVTLAIEVMYTKGSPEIGVGKDGWTISMRDGKISALFEETVAATKNGPLVLT